MVMVHRSRNPGHLSTSPFTAPHSPARDIPFRGERNLGLLHVPGHRLGQVLPPGFCNSFAIAGLPVMRFTHLHFDMT